MSRRRTLFRRPTSVRTDRGVVTVERQGSAQAGRRIHRRHFLAGAGGTLIGLPFLESLMPKAARAATPGGGACPKRLVLVTLGHSVDVDGAADSFHWPIQGPPGPISAMSPILEPLTPHLDKTLVLGGIDNLVSETLLSNGHNASSRTLLTYMPHHAAEYDATGNLLPGDDQPPSAELAWVGNMPPSSYPLGPSIHHFLGTQLGANPLNLRVGQDNAEHERSFYASTNTDGETLIQIAGENPNPLDAFGKLFDSGSSAGTSAIEQLRAKRGSVLDTVIGAYDSLILNVSSADKDRLERHVDHLRTIELQLEAATAQICEEEPSLLTPPGLPSSFENGLGRHDHLITQAQTQVIAAALRCQVTPLVHLHMSNMQNNRFPFLNDGVDLFDTDGLGNWHAAVHQDDGNTAPLRERRLRAMRWYSQILADLVHELESIPEGDGTVMDNTLIVCLSSLRYNWHGTADLPVVMLGDLGGALHTGRHLHYGGFGTGGTLGDLWTTIANLMLMDDVSSGFGGAPVSSFGWNTGQYLHWSGVKSWQNGNLPNLLAG